MKFLVGKKDIMTQVFMEDGEVCPVTIIEAGPVVVTQVKTKEKDGYTAIQVGFDSVTEKHANKPRQGHLKNIGNFRTLKEFRITPEEAEKYKRGDSVDVSVFAPGEKITVSSISKGKGFQGGVKRHGFHGGPRTHGQKHSEREPGSIGGGLRTRVPKGMRMAGRMGNDRVTVKNVKVVEINKRNNILLIKGAIPGRRGTIVEIKG